MKREGDIVSVGTDWITVTTARGYEPAEFIKWCYQTLADNEPRTIAKPWAQMGYKGRQKDTIKAGVRGQEEAILMATGEMAEIVGRQLPVVPFKVTRFDLQVTLSVHLSCPYLASKSYAELRTINAHRVKPRYLKFISSNTGDTLYVGKRSSAIVLRLYDKTEFYKPGEIGQYWRYEVEFKKAAAQRAYEKWANWKNKAQSTAAQVTTEFSKRGLEPGFPNEVSIRAIEVKATASNNERRMAWLKKCVAPVVVQLVYNGLKDDVLKVLRLTEILFNEDK
jgi:hypothetical protein